MRIALALTFLLVASGAQAQVLPDPDPPQYVPLMQVLTVMPQGSGYVYDLDGQDENVAAIVTEGYLVVRAPGLPLVKVIIESAGPLAGTEGPNSVELSPEAPMSFLRTRTYEYTGGATYSMHAVTVLVCSEPTYASCATWTAAEPLDGTVGLVLKIVDIQSDDDTPYYIPAPMPDRANPDDD